MDELGGERCWGSDTLARGLELSAERGLARHLRLSVGKGAEAEV